MVQSVSTINQKIELKDSIGNDNVKHLKNTTMKKNVITKTSARLHRGLGLSKLWSTKN